MSSEESQTAILVAAEALLRASGWPACRGQPSVAVPIGVLAALAGACEVARGSEGDPPMRSPGLCQMPDCWRYAIVPGGTCFQCSELATAERIRDVETVRHEQ